jgi:hypothetical protein
MGLILVFLNFTAIMQKIKNTDMEFVRIVFALFFAAVLTVIFNLSFNNTGRWKGFWVFFALFVFISLGAGQWAAPRGPSA